MAPALEDRLPDTFNGEALAKSSFDGTALGADVASRSLLQFLAAHGRQPTEFTEAASSDPRGAAMLTFEAFHLEGVDANEVMAAVIAASVAAAPTMVVTTTTVGGRTVTKATDAHGIRYIYAKDGYVYGLQASDQGVADAALALLP